MENQLFISLPDEKAPSNTSELLRWGVAALKDKLASKPIDISNMYIEQADSADGKPTLFINYWPKSRESIQLQNDIRGATDTSEFSNLKTVEYISEPQENTHLNCMICRVIPDSSNVDPLKLLEHTANSIDNLTNIRVIDVVYHNKSYDGVDIPQIHVYFSPRN